MPNYLINYLPKALAIPNIVTSSRVGPTPPVVIKYSTYLCNTFTSYAITSMLSGTETT